MKLLDTTILVDLLRRKEDAKKKVEGLFGEYLYTTRINIFEVLIGTFSIKSEVDREKRLEDSRAIFSKLQILELDEKSTITASEIGGQLNRKGITVESGDCLIAGIALANNINTIITKNTKHFENIEGIKTESY